MPDNKDYKKDIIQKISVEKKIYPGDHFILSSANEGWFVKEGSLKLFFTDSSGLKENSKRFFLCDMEQGEYFYGIGRTTGQAQFIVTTSAPTVLLRFDNNLVFADKKYQDHLQHSLMLNHDWATKINGIFFKKSQPKQKQHATPATA